MNEEDEGAEGKTKEKKRGKGRGQYSMLLYIQKRGGREGKVRKTSTNSPLLPSPGTHTLTVFPLRQVLRAWAGSGW